MVETAQRPCTKHAPPSSPLPPPFLALVTLVLQPLPPSCVAEVSGLTPEAADASQEGPDLKRVDVFDLGQRVRALGYRKVERSHGILLGEGGDRVLEVRSSRRGTELAFLPTGAVAWAKKKRRKRGGKKCWGVSWLYS